MKTHVNHIFGVLVALAILLTLPSAPGITRAQDNGPKEPSAPDAVAPGAMPIQGKLTNASGTPLNGTYTITFKLYDVDTGGTELCGDVLDVTVTNGLFSTYMDHCYGGFLTGQKVWLGIKVGADPEMTPRQVIYPVAYSLGLVPGVVVEASVTDVMTLRNSYIFGKALTVSATAASGTNYGIYGTNASPNGIAGYFYNDTSGTGVTGESFAGAAISAKGTGKITSTANSYLWISGNNVRPFSTSDTVIISMDTIGGAMVQHGSAIGKKNVLVPITITGPLYGQDVKISDVDIFWKGETDMDAISYIRMRRQTGICNTSACYVDIIADGVDKICDSADPNHAEGCTVHYTLTTNNLITSSSGIFYLYFELSFSGPTTVIQIGGVRLTLEHD